MSIIRETFTVMKELNTLRIQQGEELIIDLTLGQPHLPANPKITSILKELSSSDSLLSHFGYSDASGAQETKKIIAEYLSMYFKKLNITPDNVMCTNGANQANWNALSSFVFKNDFVVTFAPYFGQYKAQIESLGAKLISIDTTHQLFRPALKELDKLFTENKSIKCFILNNPANPSGIVWDKQELIELSKILKKHPHVFILQDEVYRDLSYTKFISLLDVSPELFERTVTTFSMSKSLAGAPALRIGMALASSYFILKMKTKQMLVSAETSHISQKIIQNILTDIMQNSLSYYSWEKKVKATYKANLKEFISQYQKRGIHVLQIPKAGFFLLIDCSFLIGEIIPKEFYKKDSKFIHINKLISTDKDICFLLMEIFGIATIPGSAFGLSEKSGIIRISLATHMNNVKKSIDILETVKNKFKVTTCKKIYTSQLLGLEI